MKRVEGSGALATFCMDTFEVTTDDFSACLRAGACTAPVAEDGYHCNHFIDGITDHPVNCVDAAQAESYCRWRGKRLPDDSEWLWAAHGGARGTEFPWGDVLEPGRACLQRGENSGTCVVGSFDDASPEGLRDLVGNVAEWTLQGERGGLRGGSWLYRANMHPGEWRSEAPSFASGFRCAASLGSVTLPVLAARWTDGPGPPPEAMPELGRPAAPPTLPSRSLEHLDVLGAAQISRLRWTELPDGLFIPFAPADPRSLGLPTAFDPESLPPALRECTPLRGLRSSVVLHCKVPHGRPFLASVAREDWRIEWQNPFRGESPTDSVYFGTGQFVVLIPGSTGARGRIFGYSLSTGRALWSRWFDDDSRIFFAETGIYCLDRLQGEPTLIAIDPATAEPLWRRAAACGPASADGLVLEDERGFHSIDPRTGVVLATLGAPRERCDPMHLRDHAPLLAQGRRFERSLTAMHEPGLQASELRSGRVLWQIPRVDFSTVTVGRDAVYVMETEGTTLFALDPETGAPRAHLTIGRSNGALRSHDVGGASAPLIVAMGPEYAVTLGRVAAPRTFEDYSIRGWVSGPLSWSTLSLGLQEVRVSDDRRFIVTGSRARGTRLRFESSEVFVRPESIVLDGRRRYDLGEVRVIPRD